MIAPAGEAVVYEYDAAGNIAAVWRIPADALAIFAFTPRLGARGDRAAFTGLGFGVGISAVTFNGSVAKNISGRGRSPATLSQAAI